MPRQDTIPDFPVQDGVRFAHLPNNPGYAASDDGFIWTCRYHGYRTGYYPHWRKMGLGTNRKTGHKKIGLKRDGVTIFHPVHRLILAAFVGPAPDGFQACHNNGISSDNRLVNLRWDTCKNNHEDRKRHGTQHLGERNGSAKLTADDVKAIRAKYVKGSRTHGTYALAREYGVFQNLIWEIVNGHLWSHV